jgi:hypothetical protein
MKISKPLTEPFFLGSTSSVEALHVSPLASPDNDGERPTNDGSGRNSSGSFATYDPPTCCWKTCRAFCAEER